MQEHLFKHFSSMGHNGFLNNISITLIDKTDGKSPKKRKITREELWKPTRSWDLMLKTVSDQPHRAKNMAYGLPFYGIIWSLVRRGPFMD